MQLNLQRLSVLSIIRWSHGLFLLLPVIFFVSFRVLETELVRQTEAELISQAVYIRAILENNATSEVREPLVPKIQFSNHATLPVLEDSPRNESAPSVVMTNEEQHVKSILDQVQSQTLSSVRVMDRQGIVRVSSKDHVGESYKGVQEVEEALQGKYVSTLRLRKKVSDSLLSSISRSSNVRVTLAIPYYDKEFVQGVIFLQRTPLHVMKTLYERRSAMMIGVAILCALWLLLTLWLGYMISTPLRALAREAMEVAQGKKKFISAPSKVGNLETYQLATSIEKMSTLMHHKSTLLESFGKHVSHEFKTPLTSMLGAIELLKDSHGTMTVEQRNHFYDNMSKDCKRLSALATSLLDLGRIENVRPQESTCDLPKTILTAIQTYSDKGIAFEHTFSTNACSVEMSHDSVLLILDNLYRNAKEHGATHVGLKLEHSLTHATLKIQDNGEGISPGNITKVFDPFFTTKRDAGGTGIGLSMVKSLIESAQGKISVSCDEQTMFTLWIPRTGSHEA